MCVFNCIMYMFIMYIYMCVCVCACVVTISVSPSPIELNSNGLQTHVHVLDGRPVHENRVLSPEIESSSSSRQKLPTAHDSDNDLLERITSLMTEKNRLDVSFVKISILMIMKYS